MIVTDKKCARCVHFRNQGPIVSKEGACIAHPPIPFPMMSPKGEVTILTAWPQVKGDQVCGEFQGPWSGEGN